MNSNDIIGLLERRKDYHYGKKEMKMGTMFRIFHRYPCPQYNIYKRTSSGWTCMGTEFVNKLEDKNSWGASWTA